MSSREVRCMPRLPWLTVRVRPLVLMVTLTARPLLLIMTEVMLVGVTVPTINRVGPLLYRMTLTCLLFSLAEIVRICVLCTFI